MDDAGKIIADLGLTPHPEGGWYAETYRSALTVIARDAARSALTNVYFLLDGTTFSAYHRLDADETWHFYRGNDLTISIIGADGVLEERLLGTDGPWQTTVRCRLVFCRKPRESNRLRARWLQRRAGIRIRRIRDREP